LAHHKSSLKRIRQTIKKTKRNRALRSSLRSTIKQFKSDAVTDEKPSLIDVQRKLDKAVTKGILHKKTASRYKARLAKRAANEQTV
jgi:small subunit ribosomal protein S20